MYSIVRQVYLLHTPTGVLVIPDTPNQKRTVSPIKDKGSSKRFRKISSKTPWMSTRRKYDTHMYRFTGLGFETVVI